MFDNAKQFAKQIDLTPGARTFAWISGNFIFGDIIEAIIAERLVMPEEIYIASLSISQENIDSLRNVQIMAGPYLKRLSIVLSGYQYSHEKYRLVPYMYQELDNPENNFQVAFGGYHSKVITLRTINGHTITVHGSANLRSSNSIEQIAVEIDNEELHDFNADIIADICERFGTINHNAPYNRLKRIEGKEAWEIIRDIGEAGEE